MVHFGGLLVVAGTTLLSFWPVSAPLLLVALFVTQSNFASRGRAGADECVWAWSQLLIPIGLLGVSATLTGFSAINRWWGLVIPAVAAMHAPYWIWLLRSRRGRKAPVVACGVFAVWVTACSAFIAAMNMGDGWM